VVFSKGWEDAASPALLAGLRESKTGLPYDWLRCAAKLQAPEAKRLLKEHFIQHPFAAGYKVVSDSKIPLSPAELDNAFANVKYQEKGFDLKLAKAGSKLALAHVVAAWKASGRECPSSVVELAGFKGSASGFYAWFEANKDGLSFDSARERFYLAKTAAKR
jgi:hypothetical protein